MGRGALLVGLSAVMYGIMPLVTKQLYALGLNAVEVSFWRFLLVIPIAAFACMQRRRPLRITAREAVRIFVRCGLPSGLTMLLLNMAYERMDSGIATTVHFLYPVIVLLIAIAWYKERGDKVVGIASGLILVGMTLIGQGGASGSISGFVLAAASAVTYALYLTQLEKGGFNKMSPLVLTFYTSISNTSIMFAFGLLSGSNMGLRSFHMFGFVLVLAALSFWALALLALGSRSLNPSLTAIYGLLEPITSVAIGIVFLGEGFGLGKLAGCVLVFVAIGLVAVRGQRGAEELCVDEPSQ